MNEQREAKIRGIAELIRNGQYRVDPAAVSAAVVRHMCWEDVPDLSELTAPVRSRRRVLRLSGALRVRRRAAVTVRVRPQLSA
jgi:hypothetical protein